MEPLRFSTTKPPSQAKKKNHRQSVRQSPRGDPLALVRNDQLRSLVIELDEARSTLGMHLDTLPPSIARDFWSVADSVDRAANYLIDLYWGQS